MSESRLTELQLEILRILWSEGELPVAAVHRALSERRDLAPTTVATLLKRLAARGVVTHRTEGRQFLYTAVVTEDEATASMLDETVKTVFDGDVPSMMARLLKRNDMDPGDLDRIRELLDQRTRELEGEAG